MAITILDRISTPHGLQLAKLKATMKGEYRVRKEVKKGTPTYFAKTLIYYMVDNTQTPLFTREYEKELRLRQLDGNVLGALYSMLKAEYTDTEDC